MHRRWQLLVTLLLLSIFPGCMQARQAAGGLTIAAGGAAALGGAVAIRMNSDLDIPLSEQPTAVAAVGVGLFTMLIGAMILPKSPQKAACPGCEGRVIAPMLLPVSAEPAASACPAPSPAPPAPASAGPASSGPAPGVVPWFD